MSRRVRGNADNWRVDLHVRLRGPGCYAVGVDVTVLGGEPVARSVQCGGYGDDR